MALFETDMNRVGSHPNRENRRQYDGYQPQGHFRGTAGREFFLNFLVTDPSRGRPTGSGSIHRTRWMAFVTIPAFYLNTTIFIG
jgi:hypothetical protein